MSTHVVIENYQHYMSGFIGTQSQPSQPHTELPVSICHFLRVRSPTDNQSSVNGLAIVAVPARLLY